MEPSASSAAGYGWLNKTAEVYNDILDMRVNARIPGNSKAAEIVSDAIKGPMDYNGIKDLRSYIGEMTPQQMVAQGLNPTEMKRIYGALTQDLGDVIEQGGGAAAFSAWKQANTLAL
jgi:hypothetical protein